MEEYVRKLVDNTFRDYSFDEAKEIIVKKILWYEMKLMQKNEEK